MTAAATFVVAIVLAICVPVSQLHTVATKTECCCPDPDNCKCPDHKPDTSGQPSIRACHKTSQQFVAPVLPAFIAPEIEVALVRGPVAIAPAFDHSDPHPAPAPRRPDAPS
ncbi:MAG TPA: hypothetical protein VIV40_42915 [Kofleriaceae bacterium]